MNRPDFDRFAAGLSPSTQASVAQACRNVAQARARTLDRVFADLAGARDRARAIKTHVIDNLPDLLLQFEARATDRGIRVHWARDAEEACLVIARIARRTAADGARIVKGKSMATEEIHLNQFLESHGHQVVETDLGEFVVQLDGDSPSHIVAPIVHKSREDVGATFARHGLGPQTTEPAELAAQARAHLREEFRRADIGVTGVNFAIAESGRLVIVENEGNNRLSTTVPRVHVALVGIEKLLPRDADLPLFLRLLAGSATGQRLTVYTHLVSRPRRPGELDGPDEVHVVLLDNGRSRVRQSALRAVLGCIRCGACLNVCPVYRRGSGHAYRHVYSGPIGAVLAPALEGTASQGHLARASTLCGECQQVCPVEIPIPDLLLDLRAQSVGEGPTAAGWFLKSVASKPPVWRAGLTMLPMAPAPLAWTEARDRPRREGREFRRWWRGRA